jgi:hypothetical protein
MPICLFQAPISGWTLIGHIFGIHQSLLATFFIKMFVPISLSDIYRSKNLGGQVLMWWAESAIPGSDRVRAIPEYVRILVQNLVWQQKDRKQRLYMF